jgi:hypothetical protein
VRPSASTTTFPRPVSAVFRSVFADAADDAADEELVPAAVPPP